MSVTCDDAAQQVTRQLGFDCTDVSPVASVRSPFELFHWTMPVLELLIIAGAIFALVHAIRRYREGDPVNLALWFAPLVYLFVTEPPLYFPEWFGLDDIYGFIFAHNQFTVQFMWDRLPLYIIAIYPVMFALSYETVRVLGIFRNRGALVGCGRGRVREPDLLRDLRPDWPAAGLVGLVRRQPDRQPPGARVGADEQHAAVRLGLDRRADVPRGALHRTQGKRRPASPRLVAGLAHRAHRCGSPRQPWRSPGSRPSFFGGDDPERDGQAWVLGIELGLVWIAGAWILFTTFQRRGTDEVVPMSTRSRSSTRSPTSPRWRCSG